MADQASKPVVSEDIGKSNRKFSRIGFKMGKKRLAFIGLVILLIIGGTVTTIIITQKPKPPSPEQIRAELNDLNSKTASLEGLNKSAEAAKLWEDYLKNNLSKEAQFEVYIQLGNSYLNADRYDKAREAYNKAHVAAGKDTTAVAYGLALIDTHEGNKTSAIENYKKAIASSQIEMELLASNDPNRYQYIISINGYKDAIIQLGGQP